MCPQCVPLQLRPNTTAGAGAGCPWWRVRAALHACMHALPLVAASIRPGAGRRGALLRSKALNVAVGMEAGRLRISVEDRQARAHEWRHSGAGRCVALAGRQLCSLLQRVTRANAQKGHQALRSREMQDDVAQRVAAMLANCRL